MYSAPGGLRQDPGRCRKIAGRSQNSLKRGVASGSRTDVRTCGGSCRGRPDRVDVGGRAGTGRSRCCHCERRASQDLIWLARRWSGITEPSRYSISAESPIASSRGGKWRKSRGFRELAGHQRLDHPTSYGLALWQNHIERILSDWVGELAVPIYRECEVAEFAQDPTGVDVGLADGRLLRAEYLVGCDGGRSAVRKEPAPSFRVWDRR